MKKQLALLTALSLACGAPVAFNGPSLGFTAVAQNQKATGTIVDETGEPLAGVSVIVKGKAGGVATNIDGQFSINAKPGDTIVFSYVGYASAEVKYAGTPINIALKPSATNLDEVVVTALGIKKDKKSLGYAIDDIGAEELMRNKSTNAINSLAGKIAGVNITQAGGAAGAGSQIILRGGTSLERDNQPLFVVDGVIYDNSTTVAGNSAFDGSQAAASTSSNRVMDINPEDIENMSVLKGPAASALYGSKAANGVVIITTKKGKDGNVEVNLSTKYTTTWAKDLPETQKRYGAGYWQLADDGTVNFNDYSYNSWGREMGANDPVYDNIGDFFRNGGAWDTNVSVAGGNQNGTFFLSGSYYNQDGIIRNTGYEKTTFRFNGEQKWKMFTFGANVAYSQANTDKTLTSASLYNGGGTGTMTSVYRWSPFVDMKHYLNEDGTRYREFPDRQDPWDDRTNPYWIINKDKLQDQTERFTGSFNVKVDLTDWWWISYRMGIDSYTVDDSKKLAAGGAYKEDWYNGMYSENQVRYKYWSNNVMTNFNKTFGDFSFNLLGGFSSEDTRTWNNYRMGWNFIVPEFYAFDNTTENNRKFQSTRSHKRLLGLYGEFRADWKNTVFLTVTARNDWTSTLPKANRSYFYPSYSGAVVFTQFLQDRGILDNDSFLTFGKVRASWARVGKDTGAYELDTAAWPTQEFLGGFTGTAAYWQAGNPFLKPEITESTELGIELRFLHNRLKLDYAYYTNNSKNQIMSPRLSNFTGYILRSVNAGDVYNKGMELSISGTPIETKDWTWETGINISGNRGTVKNLMQGVDILYVTDVQVGNAKAASFPDGKFMAISGTKWQRVNAVEPKKADYMENGTLNQAKYDAAVATYNKIRPYNGQVILDENNLPAKDKKTNVYVGNREPKFSGGWNNTIRYKDFTFNMLWEFRVGGAVYNGTQYAMTGAGTSMRTADRETLTIEGVKADGNGGYEKVSQTFKADEMYVYNKKSTSGRYIINQYYQDQYLYDVDNFLTDVNLLRLRTVSLSYSLPKSLIAKQKVFKNAVFTATANNLLLFTNYDGDPEVAAAGSGRVGSSSVGIDYCGVPSTASFSFGVNLTF